MPREIRRILGQISTGVTVESNLYTVPVKKSTVISSVNICNLSVGALTYRVAAIPSVDGLTAQAKHFLAYDASLSANNSVSLKIGMTLAENDKINVQASQSFLSFTAFGVEIEQ